MDRRRLDVIMAAVFVVASIFILSSDSLVQGGVSSSLDSMVLPRVVAVLIIAFSLAIGIPSLLKILRNERKREAERVEISGFAGVAIYVGIFFVYWYLVPYVGFLVATPFVMFCIALLLGGRNWMPMIAMSILVPAIVFYGSSHFLRVYLPTWMVS